VLDKVEVISDTAHEFKYVPYVCKQDTSSSACNVSSLFTTRV